MKKLTVKKGATCMACLECVEACSNAYYKESNVLKILHSDRRTQGRAKANGMSSVRKMRRGL